MDKPATKIINRPKKKSIFKDRASWELLLLCLPALVGYIMFCYVPMVSGVVLPFKNYKFAKGIFGSQWCGLKNFEVLIKSSQMGRIMRNTVLYSVWFMIIGPVFNIIFALLLFEIKNRGALKFYQTVITFPNFMSMVVVGFITYAVLAPKMGLLDQVVRAFGGTPVDVYTDAKYWPAILTIVNVWKGVGMGSMMYFASLMGVDVSLTHLIPLVCIFTILACGSIFSGSFDLFYNIPRNVTILYETTDILNTYVYRMLQAGTYTQGAAVGFFQSIAGLILVVATNLIVRRISPENSLF